MSSSGKDIWNEMLQTQNKFDALKVRLNKQEANLMNEQLEQKFKIGAILSLISVQSQQQNEGMKSLLKTMADLMPVVSMSLTICQQLSAKTAVYSNEQQDKLSFEAITQQTHAATTSLEEEGRFITNKHAEPLSNFETNKQLLQRGFNLFISVSE